MDDATLHCSVGMFAAGDDGKKDTNTNNTSVSSTSRFKWLDGIKSAHSSAAAYSLASSIVTRCEEELEELTCELFIPVSKLC